MMDLDITCGRPWQLNIEYLAWSAFAQQRCMELAQRYTTLLSSIDHGIHSQAGGRP